MLNYDRTIIGLGAKARSLYSSVFSDSDSQDIEEGFYLVSEQEPINRRVGGLVLFLLFLVMFLAFWATIAVIGNASIMSEKVTFIAVLLLFLTPSVILTDIQIIE